MPTEIKDLMTPSTPLTITLAGLASSTSGVGRQSAMVDNTVTRHQDVLVMFKLTQGTSPTGNRGAQVYLIRDDNHASSYRSDGAADADAALTLLNAQFVGGMGNKSIPATGDPLYGEFLIHRPGPKWGIAIVHDTGVALDATAGNHYVRFIGLNSEVQ
jgi:hypothetical protein